MPLVGGGGSPNVAGGNPPGTGTSFNYIGDDLYAHSGAVDANNIATTLIEASTGAHYIVAEITCNAAVDISDEYMFLIYLDDEQVMGIQTENDSNIANRFKVIIPAFAKLKITAQNVTGSSSYGMCAVVTGRVYA